MASWGKGCGTWRVEAWVLELREAEAEKGVELTSDPGDGRREGPGIYLGAEGGGGRRRKCRWRKEEPNELAS